MSRSDVKSLLQFERVSVTERVARPEFPATRWSVGGSWEGMRLPLRLIAVCVFIPLCRAAPPAPLAEAIKKAGVDWGRWAYTETTLIRDAKGRSAGPTIVRFDPSKKYEEQFEPIKINGKAPTPKQLAEYRNRGISRGQELAREAEQPKPDDAHATIGINNQTAEADFDHAQLFNDTGQSLEYEVPLRGSGAHPLPADKLQLLVRVSRDRHELESGTIRLISPIRRMLVAKITHGQITMEFASVDPAFPPAMVSVRGDIALTFFMVKTGGSSEQMRTDFKHVKPYDERFVVKVGAMKAFGF